MAALVTPPGVTDGGFAKTNIVPVMGGPVAAPVAQLAPAKVEVVAPIKAPETAPTTGGTVKDLMLARANQFKKEAELKAREEAVAKPTEAKAPEVPPATKAEATKPVEAAPAVKADAIAPEDAQWQTLWNEESAKDVASIKADPKFKALSAMGVAEMVPARMLSHFKEKGEFISAAQVAEQYQKEILDGATAVVTAMGFKLVPLDVVQSPAVASTTSTAPVVETDSGLKPEKGESYTAFQARKAAAANPVKASVTLSNRPTDVPAAKPDPDASKPLPGESYVKFAERMRKAGTPVGGARASA